MYDELEHVCRAISNKQFWPEGWIAVRQTMRLDSEQFIPEIATQLASLEAILQPRNLVQRVRSIVMPTRLTAVDLEDFEGDSNDDFRKRHERNEAIAKALGRSVAVDEQAFDELLAELVSGNGNGRLWAFGQGLVEGAEDPHATWERLVGQLAVTAE